MRLPMEILAALLVLVVTLFLVAPSTMLALVFLAVLWAAWRRRPRRQGVRR